MKLFDPLEGSVSGNILTFDSIRFDLYNIFALYFCRQRFHRWEGAIANHLSTRAAAQSPLSDGRFERGSEGSNRKWIPDRSPRWLRQTDYPSGFHRHGPRPCRAPYVLPGLSRERQKFDAMHRAQNRRHHRDRSGHGSSEGHDGYVRLRWYPERAERRRRAQIPSGSRSASRT